ncbi:hypothetical protein EF888_08050 [Silicimonas algicola]|uniref:Uncharacterized protein n=1 Tax=Silicimonas algicola TaxID=1826607 RepID=A0A316G3X8_9RHOB|nr:hypothetical protein [Silicimonas algicola]AZQ67091.1 hypothetical protein EF888_08050 [Silicimonas algicola]PWK55383.1 hypothetical protein C8D95_10749 [Silicimonas algicola]
MKDLKRQMMDTDSAEWMLFQVLSAVYEDFRDLEKRLGRHLSADIVTRDDGSASPEANALTRTSVVPEAYRRPHTVL